MSADIEKEANRIDLDMFRLAERVGAFAKMLPTGKKKARLNEISDLIYDYRYYVREHMSAADRERTK